MNRGHVLTALKLLIAAGLIYWVIDTAGWDNIRDALAHIDRTGWIMGLSAIILANLLAMLRWHLLMRSAGLRSTPWLAIRLGFIGVFSNNVIPGLTGGDLVKAIYVSRENPGQRTAAVISVIVDRIVGIVALALIAAAVIPLDLERFGQAAWGIYGFLAAAGVGGALVFSRRAKAKLRGALGRFGRKSSGEGFLAKADNAVSIYRDRIGTMAVALLMSFAVHMLIILSLKIFGDAMADGGMAALEVANAESVLTVEQVEANKAEYDALFKLGSVGFTSYSSIIPIIMIISALPISPAGWGVGEAAFVHFFATVDVNKSLAAALSLTYRITVLLVSLIGGLLLVADRKRVMEAASTAHEEEAGGGDLGAGTSPG